METVITARHTEVSDRFRRHADEKLAKIEQLNPKISKLHVRVTHEANPRQTSHSERIELTVHAPGPVIRAEASADDRYAALDLALDKLLQRLRRAQDRRRDHRKGASRTKDPVAPDALPVADLSGGLVAPDAVSADVSSPAPLAASADSADGSAAPDVDDLPQDLELPQELGDSPVLIREKRHRAAPMSVEDALYYMELVGHDFYLFADKETNQPSVVYRRRGWSYGVLRLQTEEDHAPTELVG